MSTAADLRTRRIKAAHSRKRNRRVERLNECEDRISRLTSFIAQMETERLRLIVESTTIRQAIENGDSI